MLASKAALGLRVDSLSDWGQGGEHKQPEPSEEDKAAVGVNARLAIERRLRALEGKPLRPTGTAIGPGGQARPAKWEIKEARKYNVDADGLTGDEPPAAAQDDVSPPAKQKARDVDMRDADAAAGAEESEAEDEDQDEDEDVEELVTETKLNGDAERELTKKHRKQDKQREKDERIKRKLERAKKREEKAARKAAKEAKRKGKEEKEGKKVEEVKEDGESGKKRKREADGEEKKKKKKSKA